MKNPQVTFREYTFSNLNNDIPLKEKMVNAHNILKEQFPFIKRIAVALYDSETSILKTYVHSSGEDDPLHNYQTTLGEAPSLQAILKQGKPRVVNNLVTFESGKNEHTVRIGRQGYAASYTLPVFNNGVFIGFIFFNSDKTDVFDEKTLCEIDLYAHLISLMIINDISNIQTLNAAVKTTSRITHLRDEETGSHLDRMSRYSRLIAMELAEKYELDDEYIEHIFMFSPLHDIGKIGIPDSILLKPGKLDEEERAVMNTHTSIGGKMVDDLIESFYLKGLQYTDVLRNITLHHHEAVNGKGYPDKLRQDEIPLEARIVAVADVFDALTSKRAYKEAWPNEKAIETMWKMSREQLDAECVQALIKQLDKVEEIQKQFNEDPYG